MISQGNTERTFSKKQIVNRLLYSLLTVVFSVLLFPCNSFATHPKAIYAATPAIQPSTGDTLSYNITYNDLHIIKDHLGSVRVAFTTNGSIRERNDYYPFGLRTDQRRAYPTLSDRYTVKVPRLTQGPNGTTTQTGYRATAPYTLQYNGKELQLLANTTLIDYGARQYNPTLARWTTQDPMAEKYYGISPYAYCAGNPIVFVDAKGEKLINHILVTKNNDGTYKIVGGQRNNDNNIYIVNEKEERIGILGKMFTTNSFFLDNCEVAKGAIIDIQDNSGETFFKEEIMNVGLMEYMANATERGVYDFKNRKNPYNNDKMESEQYKHRGMYFNGSIASARDIGNYAAGYLAGSYGIPWKMARGSCYTKSSI